MKRSNGCAGVCIYKPRFPNVPPAVDSTNKSTIEASIGHMLRRRDGSPRSYYSIQEYIADRNEISN